MNVEAVLDVRFFMEIDNYHNLGRAMFCSRVTSSKFIGSLKMPDGAKLNAENYCEFLDNLLSGR